MKRIFAVGYLVVVFGHAVVAAESAPGSEGQVLAAMKEIQSQQAQIADNQ